MIDHRPIDTRPKLVGEAATHPFLCTASPFFNEGIAVAIGPSDVLAPWSPYYDTEPQAFVFTERFDSNLSQYYPEFGALTHFLIQTYGVETYRDAYLATQPDMTSAEQEEVFVEVFGDDIYDTFDAYLDAPKCALRTWQCDEDILPLYTLPLEIGGSTMACDIDNVSVFRMHCTSCAGGLTEIDLFSADRTESGDDFRRRMLETGRRPARPRRRPLPPLRAPPRAARVRAGESSWTRGSRCRSRCRGADISVYSLCRGPMRATRAVTTSQDIAADLRGARPSPSA